ENNASYSTQTGLGGYNENDKSLHKNGKHFYINNGSNNNGHDNGHDNGHGNGHGNGHNNNTNSFDSVHNDSNNINSGHTNLNNNQENGYNDKAEYSIEKFNGNNANGLYIQDKNQNKNESNSNSYPQNNEHFNKSSEKSDHKTDMSEENSNPYYSDNGQYYITNNGNRSFEYKSERTSEKFMPSNNLFFKNINYYFSNYVHTKKKNIAQNNKLELSNMIGPEFSEQMGNYCKYNNTPQNEKTYLKTAFDYSRSLEQIRTEMLILLNSNKNNQYGNPFKSSSTTDSNILKVVQDIYNRKNLKVDNKQELADQEELKKKNLFINDKEHPLNVKYNEVMNKYLCHIFKNNPGKNKLERLYYHNVALGQILQPIRFNYSKATSMSVGLNYEMYLASASNIYMLGHMLLLSLAYLSYNEFFVKGVKGFYSFQKLILTNSDYSFFMYNEMCNIFYRQKKILKKDLTFVPTEFRPNRSTTLYGERKVTCDMLERVINAVHLVGLNEIYQVFNKHNIPVYENNLSFSINALRIFTQVCPINEKRETLRCDFEESTLYNPNLLKNDITGLESQKELRRAYELLTILSEIENSTLVKNEGPNPHYIQLIMNQNKYTSFYKYLFWYENRALIDLSMQNIMDGNKKNKNKKLRYVYDDFIKQGLHIHKKLYKLNRAFNVKRKAISLYYNLVDKYPVIFKKSERMRRSFLNNVANIRHNLYLNSVLTNATNSQMDTMKKILKNIDHTSDTPLKYLVRGNNLKDIEYVAARYNMFYINLFIISFFSQKDPVISYYNDKKRMLNATISEKLTTASSIFIPNKLKKLVTTLKKGLLKKKLLTSLAKIKLLQHIPVHLLQNIVTSIKFTTHTIAFTQVTQNARFVPLDTNIKKQKNVKFAKNIFNTGGFPKYADKLMSTWFKVGFEEYKKNNILKLNEENIVEDYVRDNSIPAIYSRNDNIMEEGQKISSVYQDNTITENNTNELSELERLNKRTERRNNLLFNENDKWDVFIAKEFARSLDAWLYLHDNEYTKNTNTYKIVEDSKYLLENNIDDTIFFSRTVKPVKQTIFRTFFKRLVSLGSMLLRQPSFKVEHAVWFGATINIHSVFVLLEKVSELQKLMRHDNESWLINEAFIEIVDHVISLSTRQHIRTPFSVVRNPGIPTIHPYYSGLKTDDRLQEFQESMCSDHCSSVWKLLSIFALQHMKNPDSLQTFEHKFSKNTMGNKINDKHFVTNFKLIMGNDIMLHYFDNLLPKPMKKQIKSMKYGAALSFAYSLKLAKLIFNHMQLPYLGQLFYAQAPYFGYFVTQWQKERQQARIKEILGFMTLGTLSVYTLLSAMDITQQATDIGLAPTTSCYVSTLAPSKEVCLQTAVQAALTNTTQSCMTAVFSVGLFASIGPYLFAPMAGMAIWNILKSEFKILQRVDFALKGVFRGVWDKFLSSKGITRLKSIFKRRKSIKQQIVKTAENNMLQMQSNPEQMKKHLFDVHKLHEQSNKTYHHISYAKLAV
ncbi:rhoptry neck protein 2, partial [Hepatocystis sp. ex Piliocolobus tephrosceles]